MLKSKTLWASCAAILGAVSSFFLEEITAAEMAQIAIPAVLAIFLRHGVKKSEVAAESVADSVKKVAKVVAAPAKKKTAKA
tara:strand:- start:4429 stop:4671 length:243 start_codon:yes stop_codon:yes gene_type:complete